LALALPYRAGEVHFAWAGVRRLRISWNQIRTNAAKFAREWADAHYEKGETQSFYNDFFEVFGVQRRKVATFEEPVKKLGDKQGFIDLFWKGKLLVEQKSAGRDLARARQQALDYFPNLKDHELPRYILVCDFQTFHLTDLDTREEIRFALSVLSDHVESFGFVVGIEKRVFKDQDPVNVLAAEIMGKLHDALKASGYEGAPLERLLVRLLFCLFADDTGIFDELGLLQTYIEDRTAVDGSDLGPKLSELFQVLNTPTDKRQKSLDEDLTRFPYINGDLFALPLPIPAFDKAMRDTLLEAAGFSWEKISPAIFGALFQSVMNAKERRQKGAHYTTEKNILKVIEPLFLDDLRAELSRILGLKTGRVLRLRAFQDKLAKLKLFDPACGCGNFLIIAYRELRLLEIDLLKALYPSGQLDLEASALSKVDVDQFYGIEIDEFPARIAETAMWMMDHIMNNRLSQEFGQVFARIPLKAAPHIVHGDALEIDWATILKPSECSFVLGNPPFLGAKMQSETQRAAVHRIASLGNTGGTLDFVAAWFIKAGEYTRHSRARIGFVATNSITQGEQAGQLWPVIFQRFGLEIGYAHRTFAWGSDARGKAHVHVVIVGLCRCEDAPTDRRLFSYPDLNGDPVESSHSAISPYLFDASRLSDPHLVVREASKSLTGAPRVLIGSKPIDGGYFIMSGAERELFLTEEPTAVELIRPYVGAEEYLNGGDRWILLLDGIPPDRLRAMPRVVEAVQRVRQYRMGELPPRGKPDGEPKKASDGSRALAATPTRFHVTVVPDGPFLCIPKVSSERREYVPIGWLEPPTIPSDLVFVVEEATLWQFALLTSAMHMSWLRHIGGRLKSDYRYSVGLVYNTFPWPDLDLAKKERLEFLGREILGARIEHPTATLADLYDPDLMPSGLRKAHRKLDRTVDALYLKTPMLGDRGRAEHLIALYEKMTGGLFASPIPRKRRTSTLGY
jgi:hypothetical protein